MKKEFVVMQISAMRDGSPSVVLTLLEERLLRLENEAAGDLPQPYKYHRLVDQDYYMTTVLDLNEYASLGLKVGDVVSVELKKSTERKLGFARTAELSGYHPPSNRPSARGA